MLKPRVHMMVRLVVGQNGTPGWLGVSFCCRKGTLVDGGVGRSVVGGLTNMCRILLWKAI